MGNVVYVVDSGRGTAPAVAPFSGPGLSTNGRVWKMVLSPDNPKKVTSLSVFVEGDDNPVKTFTEVHQPDNIETTQTGILVTEDPGSSQQFNPDQQASDPGRATTARLWYVPFSGAAPRSSSRWTSRPTSRRTPRDPTSIRWTPRRSRVGRSRSARATGAPGSRPASSMPLRPSVRAAFLIDVQAHTFWVETAPGPDTTFDSNTDPDFTFKREGGQLLLIQHPRDLAAAHERSGGALRGAPFSSARVLQPTERRWRSNHACVRRIASSACARSIGTWPSRG